MTICCNTKHYIAFAATSTKRHQHCSFSAMSNCVISLHGKLYVCFVKVCHTVVGDAIKFASVGNIRDPVINNLRIVFGSLGMVSGRTDDKIIPMHEPVDTLMGGVLR